MRDAKIFGNKDFYGPLKVYGTVRSLSLSLAYSISLFVCIMDM